MKTLVNGILVCVLVLGSHLSEASQSTWITTWTASPEWADPDPTEPLLNINNQTVRQHVRISIGGERLRIQFSNEYGSASLRIGAATVALPDGPGSVRPTSVHTLTFMGQPAVAVPPGTTILSDAIDFPVPAGAELAVSIYFPERIAAATFHELALKRAVFSPLGDYTHSAKLGAGATSTALISVSAVLVPARPSHAPVRRDSPGLAPRERLSNSWNTGCGNCLRQPTPRNP